MIGPRRDQEGAEVRRPAGGAERRGEGRGAVPVAEEPAGGVVAQVFRPEAIDGVAPAVDRVEPGEGAIARQLPPQVALACRRIAGDGGAAGGPWRGIAPR